MLSKPFRVSGEREKEKKYESLELQGVAIWSLIRLNFINKNFSAVLTSGKAPQKSNIFYRLKRIFTILQEIVKAIIFFCFEEFGEVDVIFRVNSFAINVKDADSPFNNKTLQKFYLKAKREGLRTIVVVNNLDLCQIIENKKKYYISPVRQLRVIEFFFRAIYFSRIKKMSKNKPLELGGQIRVALAQYFLYKYFYKRLKPQIIYYHSPYNSFEPEIAAAKKLDIQTVEIFHGVVNSEEYSYNQMCIDYGKKITGICSEYVAPSLSQKKLVRKINPYYEKVSVERYVPEGFKRPFLRKRNSSGRKVLIIASIFENDIDIITDLLIYWKKKINSTRVNVYMRFHPYDNMDRWLKLLSRFPFVKITKRSLQEEIYSSSKIYSLSSTVNESLSYYKIPFINLSPDYLERTKGY